MMFHRLEEFRNNCIQILCILFILFQTTWRFEYVNTFIHNRGFYCHVIPLWIDICTFLYMILYTIVCRLNVCCVIYCLLIPYIRPRPEGSNLSQCRSSTHRKHRSQFFLPFTQQNLSLQFICYSYWQTRFYYS